METTDRIEQARAALKVISRTAAGGIDVPETYARIDALCDLALKGLQAEAMREAIRRAVEKFERYKQEGMYLLPLDEIRADLEQALNERKET